MPQPTPNKPLNIAFYTEGSAFDGSTIATKGLGGSESALYYLARELARLGHRVNIFCTCVKPGEYEQVHYHQTRGFLSFCEHQRQDIAVFSRMYEPLPLANAQVKILWLHDIAHVKYYENTLPLLDTYIHRYFMIGRWQMQGFQEAYGLSENKLYLTRNGIDCSLFGNTSGHRHRKRLIYINAPVRGLDVLIQLFPQIRKRVRNTELHIYSSMKLYGDQYEKQDKELQTLYDTANKTAGVRVCAPVAKAELAKQLSSARLSVYPSHFPECCSIASLESQAAGTPMITTALAGLNDTIIDGTTGLLLPADDPNLLSRSSGYQRRFIDTCVRLLENDDEWAHLSEGAQRHIQQHYCWSLIAEEWTHEFYTMLENHSSPKASRIASIQDMHHLAMQFLNHEAYSPSLAFFKLLCECNPSDTQAWHMQAAISGTLGRYSDTIKYCEKLLTLLPDAAPVHTNYGIALLALGRLDDALNALQKALSLVPAEQTTLLNLGKCLHQLGQYDAALEHLHTLGRMQPANSEAMDELGQVYFARGDYATALTYYRRALKTHPNNVKYNNNAGTVYQQLGHTERAEHYFKICIKLQPEFLQVYCNLGCLYASKGEFSKALNQYNTALSFDAGYEAAISGKTVILERTGCFEQAWDLIWPIVDSQVFQTKTALAYARLSSRFKAENNALTILDGLLDDPSLAHDDRTQAAYLAGSLHDRTGGYDAAFACFKLANKLSAIAFDRETHQRYIDAIIRAFERSCMAHYPTSNRSGEGLIFIIGMPRSGITLVERILSAHPGVYTAGEQSLIGDIAKNIPPACDSTEPFPIELGRVTSEILDRFADVYLKQTRNLAGNKSTIVDKMPSNFMYLGLIQILLPGARIIHCQRHPVDTCLSCYFQQFSDNHAFSYSQRDLLFFYNHYTRIMQHWATSLSLPTLNVHYESLVTEQERITKDILRFTGLEWKDECLDFHKSKPTVLIERYDQVREPMNTKSIARWKNYLSHLAELRELLDQHHL